MTLRLLITLHNASYYIINFNSVVFWEKSSTGFDPEQWKQKKVMKTTVTV